MRSLRRSWRLGKLPEPWWFDEDGKPRARELQQVLLPAEKTSISRSLKLASIGNQDTPPAAGDDDPMMERPGTRLDEFIQRGIYLRKCCAIVHKTGLKITKVISHPWFALG